MFPVLLASASPRRRLLLEQVGFRVIARPVDIDETPREGELPIALARRLAIEKASAAVRVVDMPRAGVAADTVVWSPDGLLMNKPASDDEAVRMLETLSGRIHHVTTGYCIFGRALGDRLIDDVVTTEVEFRRLDPAAIRAYVATGEPRDKAGAYGIQGMGALFVRGIRGCHPNVAGLPISEVVASMHDCGLLPRMPWDADNGGVA